MTMTRLTSAVLNLAILTATGSLGCSRPREATIVPGTSYPIDAAFLAEHLNWSFSSPRDKCHAAVRSALTGDLGFEVEHDDPVAGEIVTARHRFEVNSTVTTTGTSTSKGTVTGPDGQQSTVTTVSPQTTTSHSVITQSHKYYLRIEGDDRACTVSAFRWRAWNGEEEMQSLQAEGIQWADQNLFRPLRAEIVRRLEGAPY